MVKVVQPFHSLSASGRFGDVVYDKRGVVRKYVKGSNPQSEAQGNHRQAVLAAWRGVRVCGPETEIHLRRSRIFRRRKGREFKAGYWKSYLVGEILSNNKVSYRGDREFFSYFRSDEQAEWEEAALILGLSVAEVSYASEGAVSGGEQLFLVARAIWRLNIYQEYSFPKQDNAFLWASLISSQAIDPLPRLLEMEVEQEDSLSALFADVLAEDVPSEDVSSEDVLAEDVLAEDVLAEDVLAEDVLLEVVEEVGFKECAFVEDGEVVSDVVEGVCTEDVCTEDVCTEDMSREGVFYVNEGEEEVGLEVVEVNDDAVKGVVVEAVDGVEVGLITDELSVFTEQQGAVGANEVEFLGFLPFMVLFLPVNELVESKGIDGFLGNNAGLSTVSFLNNWQGLCKTGQVYIDEKEMLKSKYILEENVNFARPPNK